MVAQHDAPPRVTALGTEKPRFGRNKARFRDVVSVDLNRAVDHCQRVSRQTHHVAITESSPSRHELVADAVHGQEVARMGRVHLQLRANE